MKIKGRNFAPIDPDNPNSGIIERELEPNQPVDLKQPKPARKLKKAPQENTEDITGVLRSLDGYLFDQDRRIRLKDYCKDSGLEIVDQKGVIGNDVPLKALPGIVNELNRTFRVTVNCCRRFAQKILKVEPELIERFKFYGLA